MSADNRANIPDDEIDLKSIGGRIFSFFAYPFSLFFSNILVTLCFIAGGILASVAVRYLTPKTYTSSFILRPTDIKDKVYPKILADIPVLIKKKDEKALSALLAIDPAFVSSLADISITHSAVKSPSDSTNTIEVEIESSDPAAFIPVQNSIIQYLENNPYYRKIKGLQKSQIEMNLEQINKDLVQLDSLKKSQLAAYEKQKLATQNTVMLNDLINPTAAYAASSERMIKKTSLLAQTVFLDRFMLIKGCVISNYHDWPPRMLILLLVFVPAFLLLGVIFLHYRKHRA